MIRQRAEAGADVPVKVLRRQEYIVQGLEKLAKEENNMGCSYAIETDEYHGFECPVSGGACMYLYPDSKDVQESMEKVRMLGILKIWKNNGTFRRLCCYAI